MAQAILELQNKIQNLSQHINNQQHTYNALLDELPHHMQTEDEDGHRRLIGRTQNNVDSSKKELKNLQSKLAQMMHEAAMPEIMKKIADRFQVEMKTLEEEQKIDEEWNLIAIRALVQTYSDPATLEIAKDAVRINNHPAGGLNLRRIWEKSTLKNIVRKRYHILEASEPALALQFKDPLMSDYFIDRTQLVSANDEVLLAMIACRNAILKNPEHFMATEGSPALEEDKVMAETVARYFKSLSDARITEGETMLESFQQSAYSTQQVNKVYCMFKALCHTQGPNKEVLMVMHNLAACLREQAPTTINYQTYPYQLRPMLALSTVEGLAVATLKYDFKLHNAPATSDEMRGADHDSILQAIETGVFAPKAPEAPSMCPQFGLAQHQASMKMKVRINDKAFTDRKEKVANGL